MSKKKQYILGSLVFLIIFAAYAMVFDMLCAQDSTAVAKPFRLFWSEVYPDATGETRFMGWFLKFEPSGLVWDLIVSTEGWAEVDAGYGVVKNNWALIGMLGTDFTIDRVEPLSLIPQAYAIYWNEKRRLRFQSWNQLFVSQDPLLLLRSFSTYKGLGADVMLEWPLDNKAVLSAGPMLEFQFMGWHVLPQLMWDTEGGRSFKLTAFLEK